MYVRDSRVCYPGWNEDSSLKYLSKINVQKDKQTSILLPKYLRLQIQYLPNVCRTNTSTHPLVNYWPTLSWIIKYLLIPVADRLLGLRVRIPPGAWMFVCCVLSGRGLCDGLITRLEDSYRLWGVLVCDHVTSGMRRLKLVRVVNARYNKNRMRTVG
jgi:hypothetical protein